MIKIKYNHNDNKYKKVFEWSILIIGIILAYMFTKYFILPYASVVTVPTGSMEPTISKGDHLIATSVKFNEPLHIGDIVVFVPNKQQLPEGSLFIKRLIGLPGDHINIVDGNVYVDGKELNEPYVKELGKFNGSYIVPKGDYFFLGDNRTNSDDSRYWSNPYISADQLRYVAKFNLNRFKSFKSNYGYEVKK